MKPLQLVKQAPTEELLDLLEATELSPLAIPECHEELAHHVICRELSRRGTLLSITKQ